MIACLFAACSGDADTEAGVDRAPLDRLASSPPLRIALATHAGDSQLDEQIRASQAKVRDQADEPQLERLATLFIDKARVTGDAGFYQQARACADAMPATGTAAFSALLIRGHVHHALHDFVGAETIARQLVAGRGMFLDQGLLGDVLLDQGRMPEARAVYQKMLDLKPCLQSYSRAAQVRWLIGDTDGCRQLLGNAASAGSGRDPESMAWVMTRLAVLELQCSDYDAAMRAADAALERVPQYPTALFARGRAAFGLGHKDEALSNFAAAAERYPLPEHLWAYADALLDAGRTAEAAAVQGQLTRTGEREDPRSFALWLATMQREGDRALRLAQAEYGVRQDALTLDALAFTRLRTGDLEGARSAMQQALDVGVLDARVLLHAALVEQAAGERPQALAHLDAARQRQGALLPSERDLLADLARRL